MIKLVRNNLTKKYIEDHVRWRNNVLPWLRTSELTTFQQQELFLTQDRQDLRFYQAQSDGKIVGTVGLTGINPTHKTAEISLLIGDEYRGRGYALFALKELLKVAFDEFGLNLVWGGIFAYPKEGKEILDKMKMSYVNNGYGLVNPGIKLCDEIGFKLEGNLRGRYIKYGFNIDSLIYSIKKNEMK